MCNICDKYFSTPFNLRVHKERLHSNIGLVNTVAKESASEGAAAAADGAAAAAEEAAAAADTSTSLQFSTNAMKNHNHAAALPPPEQLKLWRGDASFHHPFTMCISSASKGGKTYFTK